MASVIVIENGADLATLNSSISELPESNRQSLTIVADKMPAGLNPGQTFVSSATNSMAEAIQQATTRTKSDAVIFVDARMSPSTAVINALAEEISSNNSGFAYAAVESNKETMTLGEVSADSLVALLSSTSSWPFMCVAVKRSVIDACARLEGENMFSPSSLAHASITDLLTATHIKGQLDVLLRRATNESALTSPRVIVSLLLSTAAYANPLLFDEISSAKALITAVEGLMRASTKITASDFVRVVACCIASAIEFVAEETNVCPGFNPAGILSATMVRL